MNECIKLELYLTEELFSGSFKTWSVIETHFQLKDDSCPNKGCETMLDQIAEKKDPNTSKSMRCGQASN